jgi:hypothetical protein
MPLDDANEMLQGGGRAFSFEKLGDMVEGEVLDSRKEQQRDPVTGKGKYFDSGDKMMQLVLILQTDLNEDEEDDGRRAVYLKGGKYEAHEGTGQAALMAVQSAVRKTGKPMEEGGRLAIKYTGNTKAKPGLNPAKLYTAVYKPPTMGIDLEEMA